MSSKTNYLKLKDINYICSSHLTEDIGKVKVAMKNLLPEDMREKKELTIISTKGHAGNDINLLELTISKSKERKLVLDYLAENMDDFDKNFLYEYLDSRIDEDNCFYFRFNKQEAYQGKLRLDDKDNTIRVMIKFIVYKSEPDQIKNALLNYGLIKK